MHILRREFALVLLPLVTAILLKLGKAHRIDPIITDMDENDIEFTKKVMAEAQPFGGFNQSSYRQLQNYNNQDDDSVLAYGFNMSLYSLKYAGCSAVSTFSDSLAQDPTAKTVFKTIENVVFRLCPKATCYDWTVYGCLFDFGQYIIRLDTWMKLISTYREEKLYKHCQTCKQCFGDGYYRKLINLQEIMMNSQMNQTPRQVVGEDENEENKDGDNEVHCDYYSSSCADYVDMCESVVQDPYTYSNYFGCTAVSVDNGSHIVYLGPHCLSDKATIVIGVFADNQCSEYIGNSYDAHSLTGVKFDLSNFYKTSCYSCEKKQDTFRRLAEDHEDESEDPNNSNDQYSSANEVCTNLYTYAGKCDKFFVDSKDQSSYYSDGTNEHLMCHFIDSVVTGAYDEQGFIYVDAGKYKKDNSQNEYASYAPVTWEVTFSQIAGLLFLSFCLLSLLILNCYLHQRVNQQTTWMVSEDKTVPILWKDSGIGNLRSEEDDESVNHVFI